MVPVIAYGLISFSQTEPEHYWAGSNKTISRKIDLEIYLKS